MAGCDFVPDSAPEGTNQTIVDSAGARYVHSDTPTFTRDVDALFGRRAAGERARRLRFDIPRRRHLSNR